MSKPEITWVRPLTLKDKILDICRYLDRLILIYEYDPNKVTIVTSLENLKQYYYNLAFNIKSNKISY